tara:strand:+ start:13 stop:702 length:690 start_codon:yes stop_codon:yes gene_type:complete
VSRTLFRKNLLDGAYIECLVSEIGDGDFSTSQLDKALLEKNRLRLSNNEWNWLSQEHGTGIVQLEAEERSLGSQGDAMITSSPGKVISVTVADCMPVLLIGESGTIALIHLGWRGIINGLLDLTVESMKKISHETITSVLGPCIKSCCYEFGQKEIGRFCEKFGKGAEATTLDGRPSIDLKYCVKKSLETKSIKIEHDEAVCTKCDPRHWSFREDSTNKRQVMIAFKSE